MHLVHKHSNSKVDFSAGANPNSESTNQQFNGTNCSKNMRDTFFLLLVWTAKFPHNGLVNRLGSYPSV